MTACAGSDSGLRGYWKTDNWADVPMEGDVGGLDTFGVEFTDTGGSYDTYVVSVAGTTRDAVDGESKLTENRSHGDGAKGVEFQLRDYVYKVGGDYQYVGDQWAGSCTYDHAFAAYSGVVTPYYTHTYKAVSTDIDI